jgi:hypothetical protein
LVAGRRYDQHTAPHCGIERHLHYGRAGCACVEERETQVDDTHPGRDNLQDRRSKLPRLRAGRSKVVFPCRKDRPRQQLASRTDPRGLFASCSD